MKNLIAMLDEQRFSTLLAGYFDELLEPAEREEFDEIIQASSRAREMFWEQARLHAAIRAWGERHWSREPLRATSARGWAGRARVLAFAPVAAAVILLCFAAAWRWNHRHVMAGRSSDVAVVMGSRRALWSGVGPRLGESISPQPFKLVAGEVSLGFSSGAEVAVRGPAEFTVRSGLRMDIETGHVAAHVPPEALGFIVDTPAVDVIDLGTEFGVVATSEGAVDVQVFNGSVETRDGTSPQSPMDVLPAGTARRFLPGGRGQSTPIQKRSSFPDLAANAMVPRTVGAVRLLESAPSTLATLESNEFILLYPEARSLRLPVGVSAEVTKPGIYSSNKAITPQSLPPGLTVDSYLMHFKARGNAHQNAVKATILDGAVTFERPIVGIACWASSLRSSDRFISSPPAADDAGTGWGLEFHSDDHLVLSTDRRTLWVSLLVDTLVDRLRIFVEPEE